MFFPPLFLRLELFLRVGDIFPGLRQNVGDMSVGGEDSLFVACYHGDGGGGGGQHTGPDPSRGVSRALANRLYHSFRLRQPGPGDDTRK